VCFKTKVIQKKKVTAVYQLKRLVCVYHCSTYYKAVREGGGG
jgi:hypothetical protein